VLAVVQHEEQLAGSEIRHECVEQRFAGALAPPQRSCYGVRHQVGSLHRGQIHQPYAVCERLCQASRDQERQLSLAAATCSGQGHQPPRCLESRLPHRRAVLLAPDERPVRRGQVVAACCQQTLQYADPQVVARLLRYTPRQPPARWMSLGRGINTSLMCVPVGAGTPPKEAISYLRTSLASACAISAVAFASNRNPWATALAAARRTAST